MVSESVNTWNCWWVKTVGLLARIVDPGCEGSDTLHLFQICRENAPCRSDDCAVYRFHKHLSDHCQMVESFWAFLFPIIGPKIAGFELNATQPFPFSIVDFWVSLFSSGQRAASVFSLRKIVISSFIVFVAYLDRIEKSNDESQTCEDLGEHLHPDWSGWWASR